MKAKNQPVRVFCITEGETELELFMLMANLPITFEVLSVESTSRE